MNCWKAPPLISRAHSYVLPGCCNMLRRSYQWQEKSKQTLTAILLESATLMPGDSCCRPVHGSARSRTIRLSLSGMDTLVSQVLASFSTRSGFSDGLFVMTTATDHKNNLNRSTIKKNYPRTLRVETIANWAEGTAAVGMVAQPRSPNGRFLPDGSPTDDTEDCLGRITVGLTRSKSLTIIVSPLDMMELIGSHKCLQHWHLVLQDYEKGKPRGTGPPLMRIHSRLMRAKWTDGPSTRPPHGLSPRLPLPTSITTHEAKWPRACDTGSSWRRAQTTIGWCETGMPYVTYVR